MDIPFSCGSLPFFKMMVVGRKDDVDVNVGGVVSSFPRLVVLEERFCAKRGFLDLSGKFLS